MARIVGIPVVTGQPAMKLRLTYDYPYQDTLVGLNAPAYTASYNWGNSKWEVSPGVELNIPLPGPVGNFNAGRAGITAVLSVLTGPNKGDMVIELPQEANDDGELSLFEPRERLGFVRTATVNEIIADAGAAAASVSDALAAAAAKNDALAAAAAKPAAEQAASYLPTMQAATTSANSATAAANQAATNGAQGLVVLEQAVEDVQVYAENAQAQRVRSTGAYVGGVEMAHVHEDEDGHVLAAIGMDGSTYAYGPSAYLGPVDVEQETDAPGEIVEQDEDGRALSWLDASGRLHVPGGVTAGDVPVERVRSRKDIVGRGDSIMEGQVSPSQSTPALIASLMGDGRNWINAAVGGSKTPQIAALLGAYPVSVTIGVGAIPASRGEQVFVTPSFAFLFGAGMRQTRCTIAGVPGLIWTANDLGEADSAYIFWRDEDGAQVPVAEPQLITFPVVGWDHTHVISAGHNNYFQFEQVIADTSAMIDAIRTRTPGARIVLLSLEWGDRPFGSPEELGMTAINNELRRRWPGLYVDGTTALLAADGRVKTEYLLDPGNDLIHLNAAGNLIRAQAVARHLKWQEAMQ